VSRSLSTLLSSRTVRCAAVLLPLWAGTASPIQAQGGAQAMRALTEASERFSGLTVVCADFRQVLEVTLLGERRESRGELCQRRPNLFFMRFTVPQGDQVVADGSYFWIYYASVSPDQVVRLPLDPARGGLDFYREFLDRPAEKYQATLEGEESVAGTRTLRIRLDPLRDRGYRSARVWIDPVEDLIRRVEITEDNGTVRDITLEVVRIDPPVGPEAFEFRVPPGVNIVSGGHP
jgi:outer membrane lipoprotein-sorting protein